MTFKKTKETMSQKEIDEKHGNKLGRLITTIPVIFVLGISIIGTAFEMITHAEMMIIIMLGIINLTQTHGVPKEGYISDENI